jgi:hypothetical protein
MWPYVIRNHVFVSKNKRQLLDNIFLLQFILCPEAIHRATHLFLQFHSSVYTSSPYHQTSLVLAYDCDIRDLSVNLTLSYNDQTGHVWKLAAQDMSIMPCSRHEIGDETANVLEIWRAARLEMWR